MKNVYFFCFRTSRYRYLVYLYVATSQKKKLLRNFCRVADLDSGSDPVEWPDPDPHLEYGLESRVRC